MPHTRRTRLARQLAVTSALTYQQALAALAAHTAAGHPLPRTDEALAALAASSVPAGPSAAPSLPVEGTGTPAQRSLEPLTEQCLADLLKQVRPGMPLTSWWPPHSTNPGPHRRVVVAVQRPGHPVPGSGLDDSEAGLGLTDPDDPAAVVWMNLPSSPGDRYDRWSAGSPSAGLLALQYRDHTGAVVGDYLIDTGSRTARHRVQDVTVPLSFTIRHSNLSACPNFVMSVAHYLPDGTCAHAEPTCPTCGGVGLLLDGDLVVTCDTKARVPAGSPVCGGTGTWTGARSR